MGPISAATTHPTKPLAGNHRACVLVHSENNRNLPIENQYGSVHEVLHVVELFEKSWEFKAFLQKNFQQNIHLLYMQ